MSILVLIGHNHQAINPATFSTLAAAKAIGRHIGATITALVVGENISAIAEEAAQIDGISRVLCADDAALAHHLAENVAAVIVGLADNYSHILANADTQGKNVMPRVAALLDVMQLSDISAVIDGETFERPMYAGHAIATVKSLDKKKVITVRTTKFGPVPSGGGHAVIDNIPPEGDSGLSQFIRAELADTDKVSLATAKVVVAGGRGLGSKENYLALLTPLAEKLGAALGASRAAVDLGFCPNDYQIGQTGKVVAPDLYIAIGLSGAIQHRAGMQDAKTIVAINIDPDAPIFDIADYALVADLHQTVPQLIKAL